MRSTGMVKALMVLLCAGLATFGCGDKVSISIEVTGDNELTSSEKEDGWNLLFDGESLEGWQIPVPGSWVVENGMMSVVEKGDIWTTRRYGDFEFACEFKISENCNSGIFIRTGDIKNNVQTGIEVQILDRSNKSKSDKNSCGAIYDCLAPSEQVVKAPGEWNVMSISCKGNMIAVEMNDVHIIKMNLDDWDTPEQNPDGTPNKFKMAVKNFPRTGYIGLQYHGHPIWFRSLKIRDL